MSRINQASAPGPQGPRVNVMPSIPMTEEEEVSALARTLSAQSNQIAGTLLQQFAQLHKLFWHEKGQPTGEVRSAQFLNKLADKLEAAKPGSSGQFVALAEQLGAVIVTAGLATEEQVAPLRAISVADGKFVVE